ncbi:hypothetical protein GCK32_022182, partial [Trichostrongylus colubriformis]
MVLDDSQPLLRNVSRRQQSNVNESRLPSKIILPQPLDTSTKKDRSPMIRQKHRPKSTVVARREISPIPRVSSIDCLQKSVGSSTQVYDPLRRASSQISMSIENGFDAELKRQGDKLMNGLKAILKERIAQENRPRLPSNPSTQPT